jgi:hypothetical protein
LFAGGGNRRVCGQGWEFFRFGEFCVAAWIFAGFGRKGNGFVGLGVSVWLGLRFFFPSLCFRFVLDEAGYGKLGFLVQTPGSWASPVSSWNFSGYCINLCVFLGSCNAEQLVVWAFKAELPPLGSGWDSDAILWVLLLLKKPLSIDQWR